MKKFHIEKYEKDNNVSRIVGDCFANNSANEIGGDEPKRHSAMHGRDFGFFMDCDITE